MKLSSQRPASLALAATLLAAGLAASAQTRPPGTIPLDEPPPLPTRPGAAPALEAEVAPEVTTRVEDGQTIQEYRHKGRLYMVRVTPRHGRPYVMVDRKGDGTFTRQDNTLDNGVRVPQWVLLEF